MTNRGSSAFKSGAGAEKAFDECAVVWELQGKASFAANHPRRLQSGVYAEKGKYDRAGVVSGLPVAIEIKSCVGKFNPDKVMSKNPKTGEPNFAFQLHEREALKTFSRCGGLAFCLVREIERASGRANWYLFEIEADKKKLPCRDDWRKIDVFLLPNEIEELVKEKAFLV